MNKRKEFLARPGSFARLPLLVGCMSAAIFIGTGTSARAQEDASAEPAPSPTTEKLVPAEPLLGSFSRGAPPRWTAVTLSESIVPDAFGTTYAFTRVTADIRLFETRGSSHFGMGLRGRAPTATQISRAEGRLYSGLGNLEAELWFSWRSDRPLIRTTRRVYHALGIGTALPLGAAVGLPTNAFFQYPTESVASFGPYTGYHRYSQGERFDWLIDLSVGMGFQSGTAAFVWFIGTQATVTGFYQLSPEVTALAGVVIHPDQLSTMGGIRWKASPHLELGAGINLALDPFMGSSPATATPPVPEPMLELRYIP